MYDDIDDDTKMNFEKANIILAYIFSLLDLCILIIFYRYFNNKNINIKIFTCKFFAIIIIDIFSKFLYSIANKHFNIIPNEIFYTALITIEFYLILSFIYQILYDSLGFINLKKIKLLNLIQISFIYFLIIFPYDKLFNFISSILTFFEIIIILINFYILYKYINDLLEIINKGMQKYNVSNKNIYLYLKILNYSSLILFICYYFAKIIELLFNKKYFIIYIKISINIFYHSIKYLLLYIFIKLIYALNQNYDKIFTHKYNVDKEIETIITNNEKNTNLK